MRDIDDGPASWRRARWPLWEIPCGRSVSVQVIQQIRLGSQHLEVF